MLCLENAGATSAHVGEYLTSSPATSVVKMRTVEADLSMGF